jgi:ABC-2 type transport system permease protein
MNVFLRELKSHLLGTIFWCIGMAALIGASFAKYQAYSAGGLSLGAFVNKFPKALQIVFGLNGFNLQTIGGFYGVVFIYIALMGTVHAVLLGTDLISKEERDRTSEFLYVKPVPRSKVITAKLLAGFIYLVVLNLVTLISSIYFAHILAKGQSITKDVLILMAALFFLQIIFFAIGAFIAGLTKRPKAASSIATSVLMVTFILPFLINFDSKLDVLKYLTPFKYFDARVLITSDRLNTAYVVISLVLVAVSVAGTYYFYSKRDLKV